MTRKDVIIIAALINAGLLIVLCATALTSGGGGEKMVSAPLAAPPLVTEFVAPKKSPSVMASHSGDEVDQMLRQYPKNGPALPASVDDLKIITSIEGPLVAPQTSPEPVQTLPPAVERVAECMEVTVKKGDVLDKLAKTHHTTVDQIMKDNQLHSSRLSIGQVLKICPCHTAKVSPSPAAQPLAEEKYYTVKPGDTPWAIAVKNHMKLEELLEINHLDEAKAKRLRPGDRLRIR